MKNSPYTKGIYQAINDDFKKFIDEPDKELSGRYTNKKYDYPMLWYQLLKKWFVNKEVVDSLSGKAFSLCLFGSLFSLSFLKAHVGLFLFYSYL